MKILPILQMQLRFLTTSVTVHFLGVVCDLLLMQFILRKMPVKKSVTFEKMTKNENFT